jgi:hypothetical protein
MNTPRTGAKCGCKPGIHRDNCSTCEGTGWVINFAAVRNRVLNGDQCLCGSAYPGAVRGGFTHTSGACYKTPRVEGSTNG